MRERVLGQLHVIAGRSVLDDILGLFCSVGLECDCDRIRGLHVCCTVSTDIYSPVRIVAAGQYGDTVCECEGTLHGTAGFSADSVGTAASGCVHGSAIDGDRSSDGSLSASDSGCIAASGSGDVASVYRDRSVVGSGTASDSGFVIRSCRSQRAFTVDDQRLSCKDLETVRKGQCLACRKEECHRIRSVDRKPVGIGQITVDRVCDSALEDFCIRRDAYGIDPVCIQGRILFESDCLLILIYGLTFRCQCPAVEVQ